MRRRVSPESLAVLTAIASRSSGRPAVGVYRWFFGSRHAASAAATTCFRGREVRLAGPEADDVLPGRLERLRLGVDRQRGRRGHGRDPGEIRAPVTPAPVPVSVCWAMSAMIPYVTDTPDIRIPTNLLPGDGRFGAGPSKVRPEAVAALSAASGTFLGTSHRQKTVKSVVGSLRAGLDLAVLAARRVRGGARATAGPPASGTRPPSASSTPRASTSASASSPPSSRPPPRPPPTWAIPRSSPPRSARTRCRSPGTTSTSTHSPTTRPRPAS